MQITQKIIPIIYSVLILLNLTGCEKEIIKVKEDLTPPVILSEPYAETSARTATIFWTTDEPCSVSVRYVVTENTDTMTTTGLEFRQNHQVTLNDLLPNRIYRYLTISYDAAGNFTKTEPASFTTAIDTAYFFSHGWELYAAGDYSGARESFRQYVAHFPANPAGLTALGWSQMQDSLVDSSIINFNSALNLDDNYPDALAGLTVALYKKYYLFGLQNPAEKLLELDSVYVFTHDPRYTHRMIRLMLAESYNVAGRLEDAQQIIDLLYPANGLDPDDSATWKITDGDNTYTFDTYESVLSNIIEYLKWTWWEPLGLPKPKPGAGFHG